MGKAKEGAHIKSHFTEGKLKPFLPGQCAGKWWAASLDCPTVYPRKSSNGQGFCSLQGWRVAQQVSES